MKRMNAIATTFLTGLLLAGLPLAALARHNLIQEQDTKFSVNSSLSPRADSENFDIWSEINMINLDEVSGNDFFLRGQSVFVHMAKGPNQIAYPFAITSHRPVELDSSLFAIKGWVTGQDNNMLFVRYNFETFLPTSDLKKEVLRQPNQPAQSVVAINEQGIARLVSIDFKNKNYPYRTTQ